MRGADRNLGINSGSAASKVGRTVVALDGVIAEERPDVVLVYWDTNSTAAGVLAGAHHDVAIAHFEAGLCSYDCTMPAERNRAMPDHLSTLLFTPTHTAGDNLLREGIRHGVRQVGDVMLDAFLASPPDAAAAQGILESLGLEQGAYVIATLHRAETTATADALGSRLAFVRGLAGGRSVLMPLHPRTRAAAARLSVSFGGIRLVDPVDYWTFSALLSQSVLIAIDSGGVQKEAYFHRVPCVTLRSETEWPESIRAGWNRLWTKPEQDVPRRDINDYGTGRTAVAIVDVLSAHFDLS